jgi:hypothetical protein
MQSCAACLACQWRQSCSQLAETDCTQAWRARSRSDNAIPVTLAVSLLTQPQTAQQDSAALFVGEDERSLLLTLCRNFTQGLGLENPA